MDPSAVSQPQVSLCFNNKKTDLILVFMQNQITVKALYDYKAQQPDELSFCKHAIITNVVKPEANQDWWLGDYGGMKQYYFPAIYVVEVDKVDPQDSDDVIIVAFSFSLLMYYLFFLYICSLANLQNRVMWT